LRSQTFVCYIKQMRVLFLALIIAPAVWAQGPVSQTTINAKIQKSWYRNLSMSYMSFFDGPGILTEDNAVTPNALGRPTDDGLILNNNVSFKYILNDSYALDFQARTMWVMNNAKNTDDFESFRWQSPRFGVSTTFFKTEHGKFSGAINTDLPYFFPEPIGGGYIAQRRTTIATPGFFARYSWTPSYTRWSIFSLVQPRYYFYKDRHVAEAQYSRAGYAPELKNELTMSLSPSANYAFTDQLGLRIGTELIYKKLIASDWNPLNGTVKSADPKSKAWRIQPMPIQMGLTYIFSKMFEVSSYIQGYPFSLQREDKTGRVAKFEETVSVGAWISGTLF